MEHQLGCVAPEEGQHVSSMHLATKQLMGGAPHTYACIQIIEVEIQCTFHNKSRQLRRSIKGSIAMQSYSRFIIKICCSQIL